MECFDIISEWWYENIKFLSFCLGARTFSTLDVDMPFMICLAHKLMEKRLQSIQQKSWSCFAKIATVVSKDISK